MEASFGLVGERPRHISGLWWQPAFLTKTVLRGTWLDQASRGWHLSPSWTLPPSKPGRLFIYAGEPIQSIGEHNQGRPPTLVGFGLRLSTVVPCFQPILVCHFWIVEKHALRRGIRLDVAN